MNKKEPIRTISCELDAPMAQGKIAAVLDRAVASIEHTLETDGSVKWSGSGSLSTRDNPIEAVLSSPVGSIH